MAESMDSASAARLARKRARSLSPERRSEIARRAARARWPEETDEVLRLPQAEFEGPIEIGDLKIPAAVLDNGMRVLSERGVTQALGGKRGGSHWRRQKATPDGTRLPVFMSATNLEPFIRASLRVALSHPHLYKTKSGLVAHGYEATLLPEICEVLLEARRKGATAPYPQQERIVERAEILMGGLARVGIIALVDAATGYEKVRDRVELQRILEAYIAKSLLPWSSRFPPEFYEEMFRLRGWTYSPPQPLRPRLIGKLTNKLVYDKLPHGVLDELKRLNPAVATGGRRVHKFHQFLTEDVGNPHLEKQVLAVTTLMKAAPNWSAFMRMFRRAFPEGQMEMELGVDGEDD